MDECPHMSDCELYRAFALAHAAEVWKSLYCRGDYAKCERYRLSEAGKVVPGNLLPNGKILIKSKR